MKRYPGRTGTVRGCKPWDGCRETVSRNPLVGSFEGVNAGCAGIVCPSPQVRKIRVRDKVMFGSWKPCSGNSGQLTRDSGLARQAHTRTHPLPCLLVRDRTCLVCCQQPWMGLLPSNQLRPRRCGGIFEPARGRRQPTSIAIWHPASTQYIQIVENGEHSNHLVRYGLVCFFLSFLLFYVLFFVHLRNPFRFLPHIV